MSQGYLVKKRIRGRLYLYRQWSWREGGKVKTKTRCLGPLGEGDGPSFGSKEKGVTPQKEGQSQSQLPAEVIPELAESELDAQLEINPFASEIAASKRTPAQIDWERLFRERDYRIESGGYGVAAEHAKDVSTKSPNKRKKPQARSKTSPKRPRRKPSSKTTKHQRRPEGFIGLFFRQNLAPYGISEKALAREYEALCLEFEHLDLDWETIPSILIREGRPPRWRRSWFASGAYVVTLPKSGGRNRFKRAYREVLADCLLKSLKRDRPEVYRDMLCSKGRFKRGREVLARDTLAEIMQRGSKGARQMFSKQARRSSKKATDIRKRGEAGKHILAVLKEHGCVW